MWYAHSRNEEGERHLLTDHLRGTARRAREFAEPLGAGDLAYCVGLWHDLGKFNTAFQEYLLRCEAEPSPRGRGPDHKAAGAGLAMRYLGPLALPIQGHHGGLKNQADLKCWLGVHAKSSAAVDALNHAREALSNLEPTAKLTPPDHTRLHPTAAELFLRLLFSTLVDADFLDTEQHFTSRKAERRRSSEPSIERLWKQFERNQNQLTGKQDGAVKRARHEIYQACLASANRPPGMFRLTVPTGGGKTRSAMGFALRHALRHGHRRVIVVLPFITITQQTAVEYRKIFQTSEEDDQVVLEHHSAVASAEGEDFRPSQVWARLAAENWDAPIVVTTTVQLFHSLFSNMPSHTRKLHRLARSVIVLDEAQALPPHLLGPILDVLRDLSEHYGTTVVLCTATQPAFEAIGGFADLPTTEIVQDPSRYFHALARVSYEWRTDRPMSWTDVAELMREEKQALAVVNTKRDAMALLDALEDPEALHLSTMLCGRHRTQVIEKVKWRLKHCHPCRLVSTQVIEAGVDLDFPLVLRALGPLDGIIQSAGRCNREGRLAKGRVVVFKSEGGLPPSGSYRAGTGITLAMLAQGTIDMDDVEVPRRYFRKLFPALETDREKIQELRASLDYPEVANRFRMIAGDTESVVVTKFGTTAQQAFVKTALEELRSGAPHARLLLRRLQPYIVSVYRGQVPGMLGDGLLAEVMPGLYEWRGGYHPVTGIGSVTSLDPDALIV